MYRHAFDGWRCVLPWSLRPRSGNRLCVDPGQYILVARRPSTHPGIVPHPGLCPSVLLSRALYPLLRVNGLRTAVFTWPRPPLRRPGVVLRAFERDNVTPFKLSLRIIISLGRQLERLDVGAANCPTQREWRKLFQGVASLDKLNPFQGLSTSVLAVM
ncbi:hypothetical protein NMY22_g3035 [Coprinellus aureogranulatus]|nr:hypothetical protein NMY22_g3035 [Coprinellus aureogranulatus]